jgi:acyl-CoA thioester hydrolase
VYDCPIRWGDMDAFQHVNNVYYADYLQEARWDFLAATGCPGLNFVVLASQRLNYVTPLAFDGRPISVEVWVTAVGEKSFSLAYVLFREDDGVRTVHLRAYATQVAFDYLGTRRTRPLTEDERAALLARMEPADFTPVDFTAPDRPAVNVHPVQLRLSDIDMGGIVSNVKYLEFFQEARIDVFRSLAATVSPDTRMPGTVVAQADVQYVRPIRHRVEPYDVRSWVTHVGTKSLVLACELGDHGNIKARGRFVMVAFDLAEAKAIPLTPLWRDLLGSSA